MISEIHEKYITSKDNNLLTKKEYNMPLVILCPDELGYSALDLAVWGQRPKVLELLVDMIAPLQD